MFMIFVLPCLCFLYYRPSHCQDQGMRARAGSIGSMTQKSRGYRHSENELKVSKSKFFGTVIDMAGPKDDIVRALKSTSKGLNPSSQPA